MKMLARVLCVVTMVSVVAGCASNSGDVYVPKVPPGAQAMLLDYFEKPGNKVFIIAVDPGQDFAAGFDYGKSTLKEATKVAFEKCDANRKATGVIGSSYIYAINNKVVYREAMTSSQMKAAGKTAE